MKTSYRERDYTYGAAMLTLRNAIGLTQNGLANLLGVSRRAVGEWEAGSSYPKVEHLKELIALVVKSQAFPAGREAEEIRALWKAARQKVLLDEHWLSSLLSQQHSSHLHPGPNPVGEDMAVETPRDTDTDRGERRGQAPALHSLQPLSVSLQSPFAGSFPSVEPLPTPGLRVDWGDALVVPAFYGREEELALLSQWIVQDRCRVVSLLGMGGIGKSALAVKLIYQLAGETRRDTDDREGSSLRSLSACASPFEVVIFRSLHGAPSCEAVLDDCLQALAPQSHSVRPPTVEQCLSLLLSHLRTRRVLVVLDGIECLLQDGDIGGHFRLGFEGYGQFLRRMAETIHQSCLLLTSREKFAELRPLEGKRSLVRSLRLAGLGVAACRQLVEEKDLVGTETEQERLIELYGNNPLALKVVTAAIIDLFGGEIGLFLGFGTVLFGGIRELLDEHFARLSVLEQRVLCWLAIVREPVTVDELLALLATQEPRIEVLGAIDSGYRRSLIERGKRPGSFTLQAVVMEYVTALLVEQGCREIQEYRLDRLLQHGLSQAMAREYIRQTQERLLLSPLLANLQHAIGRGQALSLQQVNGAGQEARTVPTTSVEGQLLSLLSQLRGETDWAQGYGPANLIALLRLQRGHLNALDLSHLCIRGAYLQSIEMQEAKLSFALVRESAFTEAIGVIWSVAISPDGKWWASGSQQGQVCIWEEEGASLRLSLAAHSEAVVALAFSPDGRTLVSGSMDDSIKLWDVGVIQGTHPHGAGTSHRLYGPSGALLWTSWQKGPYSLAFSPDGSLLASGGRDATVWLMDPQSGRKLQTLKHSSGVFAVAFSPDGRLLASGCADGELRLWEREKGSLTTLTLILSVQTNCCVSGLAFAPDSGTLAGTSLGDRTVKLWDVETCGDRALRLSEASSCGQLSQTLEHTGRECCVAWSPDASILAYSCSDKALRLWDVEEGCCRAVLHGHTAEVHGMVFTPDGTRLLSGGADGSLRMWDVISSQCVCVKQGYWVALWDLGWSPDGTHLVSGGTDGLVTIWDVSEETPPSVLHGHDGFVSGVGWSPDGGYPASCGSDGVLLWDPITRTLAQRFGEPEVAIQSVAWSPDGSLLACGTQQRGMQVWDVTTHRLLWSGQTALCGSYGVVAWSPDGTQVVGGGEDGCVYLWESADGTRRKRLLGHRGRVKSVGWSPDGRYLASGSGCGGRGELFIWDVETAECVQAFAGHAGQISALAWCPDQAGAAAPTDSQVPESCRCPAPMLVSGDCSGTLCWWDVEKGECVNRQEAHDGMIWSLKVSPDGMSLASCGDDGAIKLWGLGSGKLLRTLRRDRPYERLNITGIKGLTEAQKASLLRLGAIEDSTAQIV
jgi:WD40 repeat protein/transcriptional regulator with XRE-family HTH domain